MEKNYIAISELLGQAKIAYGEGLIYGVIENLAKKCHTLEDDNRICDYCGEKLSEKYYTIAGKYYCKHCLEEVMPYEELEKEFDFGRAELIKYLISPDYYEK